MTNLCGEIDIFDIHLMQILLVHSLRISTKCRDENGRIQKANF